MVNKRITHMFELSTYLHVRVKKAIVLKTHGFCRLPMFGKIVLPTNLTQNSSREDGQH